MNRFRPRAFHRKIRAAFGGLNGIGAQLFLQLFGCRTQKAGLTAFPFLKRASVCRSLSRIAVVTLFSCPLILAQTIDPSLETGIKPFGSYHGGDLDSVNLANGNLILHIQLAEYPQRGALGYTLRLGYNNKGWYVFPNCNSTTGICRPYWVWNGQGVTVNSTCCAVGSSLQMSIVSDDQLQISWAPVSPSAPPGVFDFSATTPDGGVHQLFPLQGGGKLAIDGTDIWYDGSTPSNHIPGVSRTSDGISTTGYSFPQDTNGNYFAAGSAVTMTDTLGRTFPTASSYTVTDFSGCTGPLPTASAAILTFPGFNGGSKLVKLCNASVALQSNFQASAYYLQTQYTITEGGAGTDNQMLQSVVLYNGTSWTSSPAWTFEYNSRDPGDTASINYGDLTKITLPTGGTISYTWGTDSTCSSSTDSPSAPVSRIVASRTVD